MFSINFEYKAMLIYRLKLSIRADCGKVLYGFKIHWVGVSVFLL